MFFFPLSSLHHSAFFFFFLMIRRPPSSPPFPYTTLFRSPHGGTARGRQEGLLRADPYRRLPQQAGRLEDGLPHRGQGRRDRPSSSRPACWGSRRYGSARDRKSTRLNSSHQIISYAVLCLK